MDARHCRWLHCTAAAFGHRSGALSLRRRVRQRVLGKETGCVLGLHRVLKPADIRRSSCVEGMALSEEHFAGLLEYLQKRFRMVPLGAMDGQAPAGARPSCALTFDDGWSDTWATAFPWLRKYRIPATVFLTTGSVGRKGGFWIERLKRAWTGREFEKRFRPILSSWGFDRAGVADFPQILEWLMHMPSRQRELRLNELLPGWSREGDGDDSGGVDAMLTWEQAAELSRGGVEIGAHTVTHPLLTYEDDATVEYELLSSRRTLEEKLHVPVRSFAYPNGDWDDRIRGWVERVGFARAVTTRPGWCRRGQDPYAIGRISIHDGNVTDSRGHFSPAMVDWTLSAWG